MQTLAERLIWAREQSGLSSQRSLARAAGLKSEVHVRQIESGKVPTVATLELLAKALGVTVGWLASGEGPRPSPPKIKRVAQVALAAAEAAKKGAA